MAFIDTNLAQSGGLPPIRVSNSLVSPKWYNINHDVGPHRFVSYRRDDVLLVQLFLRQIGSNPDSFFKSVKYIQPEDLIEVDGVFGRETQKWIVWYQGSRDLTTPYGKVSRARSGQTRAGKYYTIVLLNADFAKLAPDWHENLSTDGRTPPELRDALLRNGH
jgi:hypothetical protein